jgi:hypothetical protein
MLSGKLGFVMAEAEQARLFSAMDAGAPSPHSRCARPPAELAQSWAQCGSPAPCGDGL